MIRKAGTSFPSFSLPKPLFPAAAKVEDPKTNEELDFLKSSHHYNLSEKSHCKVFIFVAPRDQVQGAESWRSMLGELGGSSKAVCQATCHLLPVAWGLLA